MNNGKCYVVGVLLKHEDNIQPEREVCVVTLSPETAQQVMDTLNALAELQISADLQYEDMEPDPDFLPEWKEYFYLFPNVVEFGFFFIKDDQTNKYFYVYEEEFIA